MKSEIRNQKSEIKNFKPQTHPPKAGRNRKPKIRVGVVFGGRSAEHEVSLVSATAVMNALDKKKYEVIPIGITRDGKWMSSENVMTILKERQWVVNETVQIVLPDPTFQGLVGVYGEIYPPMVSRLDVLFPVLHGAFGEDGTMQGLFELANLPYVGAGVLGSSVGMDKIISKQLFERAGIPVAPYVWFLSKEFRTRRERLIKEVETKLQYPCFVKPANSGSSVGISKAHDRKELIRAMKLAMEYDRKILIEKGIVNAREIEVSVLGNDEPLASVPGEIISSNEFYDYDAKYVDGKSREVIPAKLPKSVIKKIQKYALLGFKAIDCAGMARVDFLVEKGTNRFYLNEINTIPGFTSISMYPKLWQASGLSYSTLLDKLIGLAFERHRQKLSLKTSYQPKTKWYQKS
ncbi:MAG: D-alanine--D-alanine ligase [Ignavibacteriae bacterium]|nr:D-alanine--D-alanine ligase [Ignavibacteriota bacterium]